MRKLILGCWALTMVGCGDAFLGVQWKKSDVKASTGSEEVPKGYYNPDWVTDTSIEKIEFTKTNYGPGDDVQFVLRIKKPAKKISLHSATIRDDKDEIYFHTELMLVEKISEVEFLYQFTLPKFNFTAGNYKLHQFSIWIDEGKNEEIHVWGDDETYCRNVYEREDDWDEWSTFKCYNTKVPAQRFEVDEDFPTDHIKPELKSVKFDKEEFNVEEEVTFTVIGTDHGGSLVSKISPTVTHGGIGGFEVELLNQPIPGQFKYRIVPPNGGLETGYYSIEQVRLSDWAGNHRTYLTMDYRRYCEPKSFEKPDANGTWECVPTNVSMAKIKVVDR